MKNEILLIGGSGYIGSVMTKYFLSQKKKIRVLDNLIYGQNPNDIFANNNNYYFKFFDLRKDKIDEKIIKNVKDVVILAGLVGDPITKKYQKLHTEINDIAIKKTINELSLFNHIENIIFISTCSNYGLMKENMIADEKSTLSPLSLYAKAKVDNEEYFRAIKINSKKTILRFATAFGLSPRMRFDLTINEFIKDMYLKDLLEVYDQNTWRPYCHVIDFARTIEAIISSDLDWDCEIFNVGNEMNNYTKEMICEKIKKYIKFKNILYTGESKDKRNYRVSFEKIRKILNFQTNYSIDFGIEEILKAFKSDYFIKKNVDLLGNYLIR